MLWWMLQNVVIAGLLAGLVHVVCRVGRIGPVGRHALWLVVLVKLLTPPLVTLHSPWMMPAPLALSSLAPVRTAPLEPIASPAAAVRRVEPAPADASVMTEPALPMTSVTVVSASNAPVLSWGDLLRRALRMATTLWIAGAIVFALIQILRIGRVTRMLRASAPAGDPLAREVDSLARRLRIGPVAIRVVPGLGSPLVWAANPLRPALLWPAEWPTAMSEDCLRGLLVHELAHVKRRDHWVGWLELAAGCLWWWNPVFWYARFQLRENAELACDGWVIDALPRGRRAYAEALLRVCAGNPPRTTSLLAAGVSSGSRRALERRLAMIMRGRVPLRLTRVGMCAVALVAVISLPAWAAGQATEPPRQSPRPAPVVPLVHTGPPVALHVDTPPAVGLGEQTLSAEAQQLIKRFSEQETAIRQDADAKIARERQDLIKQLQALQESYAKANRLDEAVAVRNRIQTLQRSPRVVLRIDSAPGHLQIDRLVAVVPERAPRQAARTGAPVSRSLEVTDGHRVIRSHGVLVLDGHMSFSMSAFRDRIGETFILPVVGSTGGHIWGQGVYTDDSDLATAAVHAGLVVPGEMGLVRVTILAGQSHYDGATSNNISSQTYDAFDGSFKLERVAKPWPTELGPIRLHDDGTAEQLLVLGALRGTTVMAVVFDVVGSKVGHVWGSDVYTDDSAVGAAAVHAGILRPGERGLVKVILMPGKDSYGGSERNGVRSESYNKWEGSIRLERVK